jgi:hypothetical protein
LLIQRQAEKSPSFKRAAKIVKRLFAGRLVGPNAWTHWYLAVVSAIFVKDFTLRVTHGGFDVLNKHGQSPLITCDLPDIPWFEPSLIQMMTQ